MTFPASHLDLLQRPGVAALSTITPAGAIQTTAVWYLLDGDGTLKVSVSDARKKTQHLLADPTINLFFIDPANPFRTLEVRGTAALAVDEGNVLRDEVGAHYGTDMSNFDRPGDTRYVVAITPTRVVANG